MAQADSVLEPHAGQALAKAKGDLSRVAVGWAEELKRIGRKTLCSLEAPMSDPRMPAILRHVLAAHNNRAETRMRRESMVDILRGIRLVVHEEAARAKAEILDEDRVAGRFAAVRVLHIEAPEPERLRRMKPQRHGMAKPRRFAFPHEAVLPSAETHFRARPHNLDNTRLSAAEAKQ